MRSLAPTTQNDLDITWAFRALQDIVHIHHVYRLQKNCLWQHLSFRPACFVTCTKYCACHGNAKMSDVLYLPRNKEELLTLQKCRISCPQQNIHNSKKRTRHARENATLQFRGLLVARILIRSRNFRATIFRRHKPLISP